MALSFSSLVISSSADETMSFHEMKISDSVPICGRGRFQHGITTNPDFGMYKVVISPQQRIRAVLERGILDGFGSNERPKLL